MFKFKDIEKYSVWGSLYITLLGCLINSPAVLFFGIAISIWSPFVIYLFKSLIIKRGRRDVRKRTYCR